MSNEHDPIREWSAQHDRAEYALGVHKALRAGEIAPGAALVALRLAGVPDEDASLLVQCSEPTAVLTPVQEDPDPFMAP